MIPFEMEFAGIVLLLGALGTLIAFLPALNAALARLPEAPVCPACRAVTHERDHDGCAQRVLTVLFQTSLRTCGRCGWAGRMRWRLASVRAGREE